MNEILIIILLVVVVLLLFRHALILEKRLKETESRKQSQSTRYGQIFEQMVPFSKDFPFDPKNFRFIGNPIDGIVFEDDKIVFCEIKLNNSTLSPKQKKIKSLVEDKKVYWKEVRG
ncbi:MAG: Holliday junction resolvase-like protein [archaeon]